MTASPTISPEDESANRWSKCDRAFWLIVIALAFLQPLKAPYVYTHPGEDCFITFRYARNQALGHGLVYNTNPPEWVEGYSNFIYTLWMVLPAWMGWSQKVFAQFTNATLLGVLVVIAALFSEHLRRRLAAARRENPRTWVGGNWPLELRLLAPFLIAFDPFLNYHVDRCLETHLYTVFLTLMFYMTLIHQWRLAGFFLGMASLTRPEGFIFFPVGLVLCFYLGPRRFKVPALRFTHFFILIFIPFLTWRLAVYNAWFPNTVTAKAQGLFNREFYGFFYWMELRSTTFWLGVAGGILALFAGRVMRRYAFTLAAGWAGMTLFYVFVGRLLHVAFRYYIPAIPFQLLLASVMLVLIWALLQRIPAEGSLLHPRLRRPLMALLIFGLIGSNFYVRDNTDAPPTRFHVQVINALTSAKFRENSSRAFFGEPILLPAQVGRWATENLPPDALLAADQMGQLGYYAQQDIIDLLGLMDRTIAEGIKARKVDQEEDALGAYLRERKPDFLLIYATDYLGYTPIPMLITGFYNGPIRKDYELLTTLRANNPIEIYHYQVFMRKAAEHDVSHIEEEYRLGLDAKTWLEYWRVHDEKFVQQLGFN